MSKSVSHDPADRSEAPPRRTFFAAAAVALGSLAALVPVGAGLFAFLNPLFRKAKFPNRSFGGGVDEQGYTRITGIDSLAVDGPPERFPVVADHIDGWNYIPAQPIGSVFVQRTGERAVRVFNTTCPHVGCSVAYRQGEYHCPCHNSAFNLQGEKLNLAGKENPSPRNMDELEVDAQRLAQGEVWVRFQNFRTGTPDRIVKT